MLEHSRQFSHSQMVSSYLPLALEKLCAWKALVVPKYPSFLNSPSSGLFVEGLLCAEHCARTKRLNKHFTLTELSVQ